jgi:hypothetical protein
MIARAIPETPKESSEVSSGKEYIKADTVLSLEV